MLGVEWVEWSGVCGVEWVEWSVWSGVGGVEWVEWNGWSGVGGVEWVECVEWSVWSGVVLFRKSHMYVHHQIGLNELINMMYFIFNLNAYFSRN